MLFRSAAAIAIYLLLADQSAWAQAPNKTALDILKQLCGNQTAYSLNASANGDISLLDKAGKLLFGVTLQRNEAQNFTEGVAGEMAVKANAEIRACMVENYAKILATVIPRSEGPLVVLMDSALNRYRLSLLDTGSTNADDISAALIPARVSFEGQMASPLTVKETTGVDWAREEAVLRLRPKTIVIHYSAFESAGARCAPGDAQTSCNKRFFEFVRLALDRDVRVIIYSRTPRLCGRGIKDFFVAQTVARDPKRAGRVSLLDMADWRDFVAPGAREAIRALVQNSITPSGNLSNTQGKYCTF